MTLTATSGERQWYKEAQREKSDTRACSGMTAHCIPCFYICTFSSTMKLSNCLFTMIADIQILLGLYIYFKSSKTPNPLLGIYPKEIIGQVPKRCMYQVCMLLCSLQKQRIGSTSISILIQQSTELDCTILLTPVTMMSCHLLRSANYTCL